MFALAFAAVGLWMLWSISTTLFDAWQTRDWQPVQARLLTAGYTTNTGSEADTYEAYARYSYVFNAQTFTGDRVALSSGGDNIGKFQRNLGRRLSAAQARGETITVWVDAANPSRSIVDRSIRWELLGFKSIFLLVFGGLGFGLLIWVWRAPPTVDQTLPKYQHSPWLLNDKWQTESIRSDSKNAMWGAWLFAAFWNLISAPLPFLIYGEVVEKQNHLALIGLLFPLVGIGLLVWAIRRTREWRRFGPTPVVLDPFPGSIGGHVGGTIDTNLPFDGAQRFLLTLSSIHSYESGSGDSRSQREKALWQDELVARSEPGPTGTRLTFRFDVPGDLEESDAEQRGDSFHLWRLNVRAELADADLDRDFTIPVYATAKESRHLDGRKAAAARASQDALFDDAVRKLVRVRLDGIGKRLVYPMWQNIWSNLAGFVIGSAFAIAGWFLVTRADATLMGTVFAGVGGLVAIAAAYMMLRSLEVRQQGNTITSIRRLAGIRLRTRELQKSDFERFEKRSSMQTQSGGRHVMFYKVVAIDRNANEVLLGEGFRGESGADAAIRFLSRELGLTADQRARRQSRTDYEAEMVNEF